MGLADADSGVFPLGVQGDVRFLHPKKREDAHRYGLFYETEYVPCVEALYQNGEWKCLRRGEQPCARTWFGREGVRLREDRLPVIPREECPSVPANALFTYAQGSAGVPTKMPADATGAPLYDAWQQEQEALTEDAELAPVSGTLDLVWKAAPYIVVGFAAYKLMRRKR